MESEGAEKGKGKKSVSAVAEGDTSSVISAGPSASQVGGNSSIITLPSSTQYKQQKSVGKIEGTSTSHGQGRPRVAEQHPER